MSMTLVTQLEDQVQKFWAPLLQDQLKEETLLPSLVNKEYEGVIKRGGDTAYVSMIKRPLAERKTKGAGAESFNSAALETSRVGIVADQRITASFEVEDLVDIQSQISQDNPKMRQVLFEALEIELNSYLYSLVAPSASAPDHTVTSVTDFNATALLNVRKLAAQAKWSKMPGWYLLVDPQYMSDLLNAQTLTSSDYVPDAPVVGGQIARQRFGFSILEDNSSALVGLGTSGQDAALAFHPDFMYLVMGEPMVKISDQHSQKKHGYVVSVDMWCGAKLGLEGALKHITVINT
jgi:hypothetical protein